MRLITKKTDYNGVLKCDLKRVTSVPWSLSLVLVVAGASWRTCRRGVFVLGRQGGGSDKL